MKFLALAIIVALTYGCVARLDSDGTHRARYLVIGLGMVWVNDSAPEAATVTGVKALGVAVSDRPGMKLAVGYSDSHTITIPDGEANVIVDFSQKPGEGTKVEVTTVRGQKEEEIPCK